MTRARMCELYLGGASTRAIAKMSGLSKTTISRRLQAEGVELRGTGHTGGGQALTARWADVRRRYEAGASLRALAEDLGCSKRSVSNNLKRMGVKLRGRGGYHGQRRAVTDARDRKVLELYYDKGMSMSMIKRFLGTHYGVVHRAIKRAGFPVRVMGKPCPARLRGVRV